MAAARAEPPVRSRAVEVTSLQGALVFRYSSGPSVDEDLHAIFMGRATTISGGFFPLEPIAGGGLCNLFSYYLSALRSDCSAGPAKPLPHQWDPRGSNTPGVEGWGGYVTPVQGVFRNFHFTSEAHLPYRYDGDGTITFFGDDDVWIFLNGRRVLDLGGTHARLRGTITLDGRQASSTIEVQDPRSLEFWTIARSVDGDIGIEAGHVYDLAIFHANRSPRDSNYELAIEPSARLVSRCFPTCGDGITTINEECDLGAANTASGYGGCTLQCFIGPYCGDYVVQPEFGEQCDLGASNGDSALCTATCSSQVK